MSFIMEKCSDDVELLSSMSAEESDKNDHKTRKAKSK